MGDMGLAMFHTQITSLIKFILCLDRTGAPRTKVARPAAAEDGGASLPAPLSFDREDAVQRGSRDAQALGCCDVAFHRLIGAVAADHEDVAAPEEVPAHVDAVLVLLRDVVIEEQRQEQQRANGSKACVVDRAAILGRLLGVLIFIVAPCGGDICKGPFHGVVAPFPILA